ncbi:MAG: hypothetical protein KBT03_04425 [Bacteroidales bacterium]|nr:hypothetical protein [Candidatus Scybalousia scybalohippi]
MIVKLKVEDEPKVDLHIGSDEDVALSSENVVEVTTSDYQKLINKPTINGSYPEYAAELVENYDEVDPTVPEWAKGDEPQEITETHVEFLWTKIFG